MHKGFMRKAFERLFCCRHLLVVGLGLRGPREGLRALHCAAGAGRLQPLRVDAAAHGHERGGLGHGLLGGPGAGVKAAAGLLAGAGHPGAAKRVRR